MLRLICCALLLFPQITLAGSASVRIPGFYSGQVAAPPAPNTVPVVKTNAGVQQSQGATVTYPSDNECIINQNLGQQQAIINWSSFNLSSNASVIFNQGTGTPGTQNWIPNSSYVALNRIWDANPSLIFGNITANGKIYLINQNGILFGPGSTVNVNGLVASALNITDDNFLNNNLQFTWENYNGNGLLSSADTYVSNTGEITAAEGGYIFLIGPNVENYGTINAPTGQIGLAAGTNVQLVPPSPNNMSRSAYYVLINDDFTNAPGYGTAVNGADNNLNVQGQLYADGGLVGMYGYNVVQNGVIRSITAYQNNQGQVELRAANQVTTGPGSEINLSVDQSSNPVDNTFNIQPVVNIGGLFQPGASDSAGFWPTNNANTINLSGAIIAPTGQVTLNASSGVNMYAGLDELGNYYYSSIDVSGVVANLPASVISGKLTSTELANDYQQQTGLLQGQTITTTPIADSSIGDISQWILTQPRSALQRSIGGALTQNATGGYVAQNGVVTINVSDGNINVQQGALINISGGMINYASGFVDTTEVVSGMKIYNISDAPLNLQYDMVLGNYQQVYSRWGVIENYSGDYYGGAPTETYVQGYSVGGDAGTLNMQANTVNFGGTLKGGVTAGTYQTTVTMPASYTSVADYQTAEAVSVARGLEAPTAGTLTITLTGTEGSILIAPDTQAASSSQTENLTVLSTKMLGDDPKKPNLNTVSLSAPEGFSTDPDADIYLQPGGSFSVSASGIDHYGSITVNSGSISMVLVQPASTPTVDERIILASGSSLDVSGQRTDNRLSGTTVTGLAQGGNIEIMDETDQGAGVFIQSNAIVDVSGGYNIYQKGNVSGGNAGTLTIQGANIMLNGDFRGYALADPNGKILGGSVTLVSKEINVVSQSQADDWSNFAPFTDNVPDTPGTLVKGELNLAGNRFDDTGFTQITLESINDLTVDANISPSLVRLTIPPSSGAGAQMQPTYGSAVSVPGNTDLNLRSLYSNMNYMAGPSSINLVAGINFAGSTQSAPYTGNLQYIVNSIANITVSENATVSTAPALSSVARITGDSTNPSAVTTGINLTAPNIDIQGTLESQGGNISASATNGDLTVEGGAVISAQGYNLPDPSSTPKGLPMNYTPINGGSITLSATTNSGSGGNLTLAANTTIDVAGSDPVNTTLSTANGSYYTFTNASNPGSLSLNFYDTLTWDPAANVNASAKIAGLQGGTLTITNTDLGGELIVGNADFAKYITAGFDDISLGSRGSLEFSGDINANLGRQLTLDAPLFISDGNNVTLSAPWIVLTNTYQPYTQLSSLENLGNSNINFTLSGNLTLLSTGFIDVIGAISFINVTSIANGTGSANGFSNVTLQAARDIRLSEAYYNTGSGSTAGASGTLSTAGNLVLDADRLYGWEYYLFNTSGSAYTTSIDPDLYPDYNIQSYGKVTIQHSYTNGIVYNMDTPIYSAGSNLTIEGDEGIDVLSGTTVAAPLGTITLSVPDGQQIHLEAGSTLTVAGDTNFSVLYNSVSSNGQWIVDQSVNNNGANPIPFTALPQTGITLNAGATGKIIVDNNAEINVSDGGSLFSYVFQPGLTGTNNPLAVSGQYVVFKADAFPMPGETVYLQGGGGLSAGLYTMLPLDSNNPQNARYAFMPGAYILDLQPGTTLPGVNSGTNEGYALTVGYTGVAGTQIQSARPQVYSVMTAAEVLQEGDFAQVGPMKSTSAGDIAISGGTVVLNGTVQTGNGGGMISLSAPNITVQQTSTSTQADGNMYVSEDFLSNKNFSEIDLGNDNTQTVVIAEGVVLNAGALVLTANNTSGSQGPSITLQSGSNLGENASGQSITNDITLSTTGVLNIDPNAVIHAKNNITLDVNDLSSISVVPQDVLKVDSSSITLESMNIFFGAEGGKLPSEVGLYLTQNMLNRFSGYQNLTLESGNDIEFLDPSVNSLAAANSLTLDASRIESLNNVSVTLAAPTVNIQNSGATFSGTAVPSNGGTFTVGNSNSTTNPVTQINIGNGDVLFAGFSNVALNSNGDMVFKGAGSLVTGGANLNIAALRVTTAADTMSDGTTYEAPNFKVVAGIGINDPNPAGIITMTSIDNGQANTTPAPGGTLEFDARKIDVGLVIQVDGGNIKLTTAGALDNNGNFLPYTEDASGNFSDGIVLREGGQILARGTNSAPGGIVILSTDFVNNNTGAVVSGQSGKIDLQSGSLIDVSAGGQGDAGQVTLLAPGAGVAVNGILKGTAGTNANNSEGIGGSLVLDTNSITDFSWLQANVEGFTESLDLRARQGNVEIASTDIITAHNITLTADDTSTDANGNLLGNIDVYGQLNASAGGKYADGGTVELYAQNNLNIQSGGQVLATGANGGNVLLSSANGGININSGGLVNVSGAGGTGQTNGTVYLRAQRSAELGTTMNINLAPNTINGAAVVSAEAYWVYADNQLGDITPWLTGSGGPLANASIYYANANSNVTSMLASATGNNNGTAVNLLPGIEVDNSTGDITIASELNLTSYNNIPGVLTLRAANDLNIQANLVDAPTPMANLNSNSAQASWGFNLVAGADTLSADFMAVNKGQGILTIGNGIVVYTENAPIRFASGSDTVIGQVEDNSVTDPMPGDMINNTMGYNLASYNGTIQGNVGGDLIINSGAIQTATGDINITVGGDLQLNQTTINGVNVMGAIRTTGEASGSNITQYWTYAGGGNINLVVDGSVGTINSNGNLSYNPLSAPYSWDQFYTAGGGQVSGRWRSPITITGGNDTIVFTYDNVTYTATLPAGTYYLGSTTNGFPGILESALENATNSNGQTIAGITFNVNESTSGGLQISFSSPSSNDQLTMFTGGTLMATALEFGTNNALNIPNVIPYGLWAASYTSSLGNGGQVMTLINGTTTEYDVTSGLATMGGGNLTVRTGGNFLAQAGTFGGAYCSILGGAYCQGTGGNLIIYAGGDVMGRFLNAYGTAEINAMGNFGAPQGTIDDRVQIELFNSQMTVNAQGEMQIGAIVNPTMASDQQLSQYNNLQGGTYTPDTSITLKAGGDVTIYGASPVYSGQTNASTNTNILPASVDIESSNGNINLMSVTLTLTSSPTGNLTLVAAGNIEEFVPTSSSDLGVPDGIMMSDIDPAKWYGYFPTSVATGVTVVSNWVDGTTYNYHDPGSSGTQPLHAVLASDTAAVIALKEQPIVVSAGGDIVNLGLSVPKEAEITAGQDIINMTYEGQNNSEQDVSKIVANGNIQMLYVNQTTNALGQLEGSRTGFIEGGPGVFWVQAGGSIDLGSSNNITNNTGALQSYGGMQTIGNANNVWLGTGQSTLVVVSGYEFNESADDVGNFFSEIRTAGEQYAQLLADGNLTGAATLLQTTRQKTIVPFLGTPTGDGNIDMVDSQIGASVGASDIFVIANGTINLGTTALPIAGAVSPATTGIWTGDGGSVNVFANQDINVNQSRIMTYYGGDITVWSDSGNINAGEGSRTAVSASPPRKQINPNTGYTTWIFTPPAVGSGIRAVTYGETPPPPGNIYLFAPSGIIDAGEAGISGGEVVLAALEVRNVANISFSLGSVGVPLASTGTTAIGTLSGSGTLTQSNLSSDTAAISGVNQASQTIEDIMAKWLEVQVIDFVEQDTDQQD
jgi:filamentous hemagglutinin